MHSRTNGRRAGRGEQLQRYYRRGCSRSRVAIGQSGARGRVRQAEGASRWAFAAFHRVTVRRYRRRAAVGAAYRRGCNPPTGGALAWTCGRGGEFLTSGRYWRGCSRGRVPGVVGGGRGQADGRVGVASRLKAAVQEVRPATTQSRCSQHLCTAIAQNRCGGGVVGGRGKRGGAGWPAVCAVAIASGSAMSDEWMDEGLCRGDESDGVEEVVDDRDGSMSEEEGEDGREEGGVEEQGPKRTGDPDKDPPEWAKGPFIVAEVEAMGTKYGLVHYLVRWEGLPAAAKTWEAAEGFKGRGEVALAVFLAKKVSA